MDRHWLQVLVSKVWYKAVSTRVTSARPGRAGGGWTLPGGSAATALAEADDPDRQPLVQEVDQS